MNRLYSNFQVLFLGLIGLIMVGGSHFNAEKYEILENSVSDSTPVSVISAPEATPDTTIAKDYQGVHPVIVKSTPVVKRTTTTQAQTVATSDSISIGGRTIRIKSIANTTVNAGTMVAKYGDKFLYGHNSGTVFGHLAGLGVGTTFTVTLGGQTTTYRIARTATLEKQSQVVPIMGTIAQAKFYGQSYDLALMTCAGTSYGNGDASHRLILFATQV